MVFRFIGNRAIEITSNNHDTFMQDEPSKPKVLLFTDKETGVPIVYKALSTHFDVS